jgi:alpha-glucosidase
LKKRYNCDREIKNSIMTLKNKHSITILIAFALLLPFALSGSVDTLRVTSPSGNIAVRVWMDGQLKYRIQHNGKTIVAVSSVDMKLENGISLGSGNSIKGSSVRKVSEQIISPVPEKRKIIPDIYTLLSVNFTKPFRVEFRVYDDGVAYRILTTFRDSIRIANETAEFVFPGKPSVYFPQVQKREDADIYHTSFEEEYPLRKMEEIKPGILGYSPVVVVNGDLPLIGLTESDLEDYPGMFLEGTGSSGLKARFAEYPLELKSTGGTYPELNVKKRAAYIARTKGTRSFPWRVMMIATEDKQLPGNDLVYRLGSPSRIGDASWVIPGNLTDEWTIDINLFNVPFRAGLNTASYKYYIDFAKRFGFDRIMMDAGWSDVNDLFSITPEINMDTLVEYAAKRGIKISMWTLSMTLDRQLEAALDQFNKWGVNFIMTDFIDRDDQLAVNFFHKIAKACADHKIMIMYHGAFPPKGFNRTWPNAVAREGLMGSEYDRWSNRVTPGHDVILAYTRMLAGGMDYEPGMLNNATITGTRPVEGVVTSAGTRCHQLSMFVVYDCPMQIFGGNPSEGMREPDFMEMMGSIPTMWDETIILDGKIGTYLVTARKKGNNWFIGGMCDWTPRDVDINFGFLDNGNYRAVICRDGINADRYAADYAIEKNIAVRKNDVMKIHLAPGGGFVLKLEKR